MKKELRNSAIVAMLLTLLFVIAGCVADAPEEIVDIQPSDNAETMLEEDDLLTENQGNFPWSNGGKQPSEYSLEEYEALSGEEQVAFFEAFESSAAFEAWMDNAMVTPDAVGTYSWAEGGKQPYEYTWEEFQTLNGAEQNIFMEAFDSSADFEEWMQNAMTGNPVGLVCPWEEAGGKQPSEYTWVEYEALSGNEQVEFFEWFETTEAFNEWMSNAMADDFNDMPQEETVYPWENGGKQPAEYTWSEYESLDADEQVAFIESFESADEFEKWTIRVTQKTSDDTSERGYPWENGGKEPSSYSWEEYKMLSEAEQEAFIEAFDTAEDFEEWMRAAILS